MVAAFRALCVALILGLALPALARERIVAGAPHICEIVAALGAADELVGVANYCDWPAELARKPRVGSYTGLSVEATAKVRPTVVLAYRADDPALSFFAKRGVKTYASAPTDFPSLWRDITAIGALIGKKAEARALVQRMRKRLAQLRRQAPKVRVPALYEIWPSPLIVPAGGSMLDALLHAAGFANVFADLRRESARTSLEEVLRRHPRVVLVPDEARDVDERRRFWRRWLPGACVYAVPADLLHRPGVRVLDGLAHLVAIRRDLPKRCRDAR